MNKEIEELNKKAQAYAKILGNLQTEVQKVIVGQHDVLRKMLICLIADGHVLVEGVPGLAKTLMIKSLSQSLGLSFQRIQFTPDLLPADIVGTRIYNHKTAIYIHIWPYCDNINSIYGYIIAIIWQYMSNIQFKTM